MSQNCPNLVPPESRNRKRQLPQFRKCFLCNNNHSWQQFFLTSKLPKFGPPLVAEMKKKTSQITQKGFLIEVLTFLKIFIPRSKLPKFGPLRVPIWPYIHCNSNINQSLFIRYKLRVLNRYCLTPLKICKLGKIQKKCTENSLNLALSLKIRGLKKFWENTFFWQS